MTGDTQSLQIRATKDDAASDAGKLSATRLAISAAMIRLAEESVAPELEAAWSMAARAAAEECSPA